jgi:hypothetical protein
MNSAEVRQWPWLAGTSGTRMNAPPTRARPPAAADAPVSLPASIARVMRGILMTTKAEILSAMHLKCLDYRYYVPSEVRRCVIKSCTQHAFRAGKDPNPARSAPAVPFGKNARPGGADWAEES